MSERKNYLKTSIYIVTTTIFIEVHGHYHTQRTPFALLAQAKVKYEEACANNPQAKLEKLTVQGTPRGIALAMFVLGRDDGERESSKHEYSEFVKHVTFETLTKQAGAL